MLDTRDLKYRVKIKDVFKTITLLNIFYVLKMIKMSLFISNDLVIEKILDILDINHWDGIL